MANNSPSHNMPLGWDHLFKSGLFPPRYKTTAAPNQSVVKWADSLPSNAFVLDLGCGVGRHTVYLGQRGFRMAGTDISPDGIEQTRSACIEHNLSFNGCVADMTQLPWEDMMFDAILSTSTICHHRLANIKKTLSEAYRVLKPGGLLLVDFLHKDTHAYLEVVQQTREGKLTEIEPDTFADISPKPDILDDAFLPHHYCDKTQVHELLQEFEIINIWADLSEATAASGLPRRGYWIASAKKLGSSSV